MGILAYAWSEDWGGIRTAVTDFWETTGRPIFEQLKAWLAVNIPIAIQTLKTFWQETLLPAIQMVWAWVRDVAFPIIQDLIAWLAEKLTQAIQTLTDFWNNTLYPAIQKIWDFVNTYLVPLFTALATLLGETLKLAIEVLAGVWNNVLKPALEKIYNYLFDFFNPIFQTLSDLISITLGPAVKWFVDHILSALSSGFETVKGVIQGIIDLINRMIEIIKNADLPDWIKPGSPTPFELGLRGISAALKELSGTSIPNFNASLNTVPSGSSSQPTGSSYVYSPVIYTNDVPNFTQEFLLMKSLAKA